MITATELVPVIPMLAPWEAADKYYPGGFNKYFHDIFALEPIKEKKLYIRIGEDIPKKDRHFIPHESTLDDDSFSMYIETTWDNLGKELYKYIGHPGVNTSKIISVEYF